jgi:hypothetical protein
VWHEKCDTRFHEHNRLLMREQDKRKFTFAGAVITTEVRGDGRILACYVSCEQGWCFDKPETESFAPMTLAVGVTS